MYPAAGLLAFLGWHPVARQDCRPDFFCIAIGPAIPQGSPALFFGCHEDVGKFAGGRRIGWRALKPATGTARAQGEGAPGKRPRNVPTACLPAFLLWHNQKENTRAVLYITCDMKHRSWLSRCYNYLKRKTMSPRPIRQHRHDLRGTRSRGLPGGIFQRHTGGGSRLLWIIGASPAAAGKGDLAAVRTGQSNLQRIPCPSNVQNRYRLPYSIRNAIGYLPLLHMHHFHNAMPRPPQRIKHIAHAMGSMVAALFKFLANSVQFGMGRLPKRMGDNAYWFSLS